MAKTIENLFIFLATYTALIPVFLYFFFFKSLRANNLFFVLICYCLVELTTNLVASFWGDRQILTPLYSVFTILEFILFASIFHISIKNLRIKKAIFFAIIAFPIFACLYYVLVKHIALDSIPIGVETVIIIALVFYYLYELMEDTSQTLVYNRPPFWMVTGILIYLAGSFFIYIFINQIDEEIRAEYWVFTNVFATIKNIFFTIGILVFIKNLKLETRTKIHTYLN